MKLGNQGHETYLNLVNLRPPLYNESNVKSPLVQEYNITRVQQYKSTSAKVKVQK